LIFFEKVLNSLLVIMMEKLLSFPLSADTLSEAGGAIALARICSEFGCSGVEALWCGTDMPDIGPLLRGYHLIFYPDWLDFWRGDTAALVKKFGSREAYTSFYGGSGSETLLELFRADVERAERAGARYGVFHVADVSIEEGYSYRWLHSDEEVIDASADLLNALFYKREPPFPILFENQWWPGLRFDKPSLAERLLEKVSFENKGFLLDTGHMMNTSPSLKTQAEGAQFILRALDSFGSLSKEIRAMHLSMSLSGEYCRGHTGFLPPLPEDYFERYRQNYAHIERIDQHRPWTDSSVLRVIERVSPDFLTHELSGRNFGEKLRAWRIQASVLGDIT